MAMAWAIPSHHGHNIHLLHPRTQPKAGPARPASSVTNPEGDQMADWWATQNLDNTTSGQLPGIFKTLFSSGIINTAYIDSTFNKLQELGDVDWRSPNKSQLAMGFHNKMQQMDNNLDQFNNRTNDDVGYDQDKEMQMTFEKFMKIQEMVANSGLVSRDLIERFNLFSGSDWKSAFKKGWDWYVSRECKDAEEFGKQVKQNNHLEKRLNIIPPQCIDDICNTMIATGVPEAGAITLAITNCFNTQISKAGLSVVTKEGDETKAKLNGATSPEAKLFDWEFAAAKMVKGDNPSVQGKLGPLDLDFQLTPHMCSNALHFIQQSRCNFLKGATMMVGNAKHAWQFSLKQRKHDDNSNDPPEKEKTD
ncbi:MAG: hypothetical protein Q9157_004654 [Trypethelium eluteriae]